MKITSRWSAYFALPVLLLAVVGYVYVRSENRGLSARVAGLSEKNDILEGEVYRLRQELDGQRATNGFLVSPDLRRFKAASETDSSSCWLFWRKADNAWYAEVTHARNIAEGMQFRLYAYESSEVRYIGAFEPIKDTVGLQKIGEATPGSLLIVTSALRSDAPDFDKESEVYRADFKFNY